MIFKNTPESGWGEGVKTTHKQEFYIVFNSNEDKITSHCPPSHPLFPPHISAPSPPLEQPPGTLLPTREGNWAELVREEGWDGLGIVQGNGAKDEADRKWFGWLETIYWWNSVLMVDLAPPPPPDSDVFLKIIKKGVVGGGRDGGRGWEDRGGLNEEGESWFAWKSDSQPSIFAVYSCGSILPSPQPEYWVIL